MIKIKFRFLPFFLFLILLIAMNSAELEARGQLNNFSPSLDLSICLGGSDTDYAEAIAVDSDRNIYIAGSTRSSTWFPDFPIIFGVYSGDDDGFVAKLDSQGNPIWFRYLGGSKDDNVEAIAVDSDRNIYIAGSTGSSTWFPDFPIVFGSYSGNGDGFIAKLDSYGNPIWFRYLGGSSGEAPIRGMTIDKDGNIYVTSGTWSFDFPVTFGDTYSGKGDVFITKFDAQGNPIWSRYLGGSDWDISFGIVTDETGDVYVLSRTSSSNFPFTLGAYDTTFNGIRDIAITKLNSEGYIIYSTYLGGMYLDEPRGIDIDENGNVCVTGFNLGGDFPVTDDALNPFYSDWYDIIIAKLNSEGSKLIHSTYVGEQEDDAGFTIKAGFNGYTYVAGHTYSDGFPITSTAYDPGQNREEADIIIVKLNPEGTDLIHSSCLGGSDRDSCRAMALDGNDGSEDVYLTGHTESFDFPTTDDTSFNGKEDVFLIKISFPLVAGLTISTTTGGTTNPAPETHIYNLGIQTQVEAIPDSGYRFNGWTGDIPEEHEDDNPITMLMDSDKFVEANFIRQYNLIVSAGTGGTTDPRPGAYIYDKGTEVTVKAMVRNGYEFSGWSDDASGTNNPITVTMDSDKSVTANFEKEGCFIATAAYGTPLHPHIDVLRNFRDKYLMTNKLGRKLVKLYYKHSPFIADLIRKNEMLKSVVRGILFPLAAFIEVFN